MNTKLELTIKNTEQRCKLTDLDINVNITGFLSKTSVTMTFLNETDLDSEGELVFPMPEGAAISGYAVDINGDLVDGVVVEKEKARITFEAEARSVEKPSASIVEHVVGNVFRTRITPLPKKATRIIRVSYVEELAPIKAQKTSTSNKSQRDVQWKLSLENIGPLTTLAMTAIIAGGGAPRARWDGNMTGTIKPLPDVIGPVAWRFKAENCTIKKGFEIDVPSVASQIIEVDEDKQPYFVLNDDFSSEFNFNESVVQADRVALLWDASKSRETRNDTELRLIKAYVQQLSNVVIDLIVFRDTPEDIVTFKLVNGNASPLIDYLNKIPYIGGSNLGQLSVTKTVPVQIKDGEEIVIRDTYNYYLMFTDGLHNLSLNTTPERLEAPVYLFSSSALSNSTLLKVWARKSSGEYFDLNSTTSSPAEIVSKLGNTKFQFLFAEVDGAVVTEIYPSLPSPIQGKQFTIAGKISGKNTATIALNYGYGTRVTRRMKFQLNPAAALNNSLAARYWAQKKIDELQLFPEVAENEATILSIGQKFNIVTPNSSFIVLESLDQYVKYEIEPPKTLPEVRKNYLDIMKNRKQQQVERDNEKIMSVVGFWQRRVAWWNEDVTSPEYSEPQIQHHFQFGFFKPDVVQVAPKDVIDLKQADLVDVLRLKVIEDDIKEQEAAALKKEEIHAVNQEINLLDHRAVLAAQDAQLDALLLSVNRQKVMAQEISAELSTQAEQLQLIDFMQDRPKRRYSPPSEPRADLESESDEEEDLSLSLFGDDDDTPQVFTGSVKGKSGRKSKMVEKETAALELGLFDAPTQPESVAMDPFSFSAAAAPRSEPKWSEKTKEERPRSEDEAIGAYGLFDDEPVGGESSWQSEAADGLSLFDNECEPEYPRVMHAASDTSYFDAAFTSEPLSAVADESYDHDDIFAGFTYQPAETNKRDDSGLMVVKANDGDFAEEEKKSAPLFASDDKKLSKKPLNKKKKEAESVIGRGLFSKESKPQSKSKPQTKSVNAPSDERAPEGKKISSKALAGKRAIEPSKPVLSQTESSRSAPRESAKPLAPLQPAPSEPKPSAPRESPKPLAPPQPMPSVPSPSAAPSAYPAAYPAMPPPPPSGYPVPVTSAPSAPGAIFAPVVPAQTSGESLPYGGQERFRSITSRHRAAGGSEKMKSTSESLSRMKNMVEETESIGRQVNDTLDQQSMLLDSIDQNISYSKSSASEGNRYLMAAEQYSKPSVFSKLGNVASGLFGGLKSKQSAPTTIPTIGFNSPAAGSAMPTYAAQRRSSSPRARRVQDQVNDVKEVMMQNIDKVMMRGENIESLVDRSEDLTFASHQFRKSAATLRRKNAGGSFLMLLVLPIMFLVMAFSFVVKHVRRIMDNSWPEYETLNYTKTVPVTLQSLNNVTQPVYITPTFAAIPVEAPSDEYFGTLIKAQDEVQTHLNTTVAPEPETDTTVNKTENVDPKTSWANWHARQALGWKEFEQKHFTTGLCFMQKWNEVRVGQMQRVLERELKRVDEEFNSSKTALSFYRDDQRKTVSIETQQKWKSLEFYMNAVQGLANGVFGGNESIHSRVLHIQQQEHVHEKLSTFYIDVAQFLFTRGRITEGATVLSTLAEIDFENPQLLRAMAMNCDHVPQLDGMTEALYRQILKLRPDEPQSYTDLATVLGRRVFRAIKGDTATSTRDSKLLAAVNEAMDLYRQVIVKKWDVRWCQVELTALSEMSRLAHSVAWMGLDQSSMVNIDRRLVQSVMDLDLHVMIRWDTDLTDMEIVVTEPSGEVCNNFHNRTKSGMLSRNFTCGYGPQEYCCRQAQPGTYKIEVRLFGAPPAAPPSTVTVRVTTDWGRPVTQHEECHVIRLGKVKETVHVTNVRFEQL